MTAVEREVAFVFADLAGYVALTEAHGNAGAADAIDRFVTAARASLVGDARLIERAGDQVLIAADDPDAGIETALRLWSRTAREPLFPLIRIGGHAGSVLERDGVFYGGALNIAARVVAHARAGQILCTDSLVAAARRHGAVVRALGPVALRHVLDPVELFEVVPVERAGTVAVDPVCQMQLVPDSAAARIDLDDRTYYFCCDACAAAFGQRPQAYVGR